MAPYLNGDPGPEFGHFTGTNYWRGEVRYIDEYDVTIIIVGIQLKLGLRINNKIQIYNAVNFNYILIPVLPVVILLG